MTAVPFDTLKLARKLEAAGFNAQQAGDTAEALAEAMSDQVATKGDIAELKAELSIVKAQIALGQWLVGGVGFGVLLLILKSFWPN
jgi:hypothetical protein